MRIAIVTGASGFIGSATVKELLQAGYKVYGIVRSQDNEIQKISDNYTEIGCDLSNIESIKDKVDLEGNHAVFYHFAWQGSAGADRANERTQLKNVQWTIDAMRVASELGCQRFIGAGSIMERETLEAVYTQGSRPGKNYVYGASKVTAHCMAKALATSLGIEFVWTFITNAYGPGEISPRLVNSTLAKCLNNIPPEFTSGTQNYDFIYITDVARAFRLIGEKGIANKEYVIGSGNAKPLKEFLLDMKASVAPELDFIFGNIPFTGVDLNLEDFSIYHLTKDTGFFPEVNFKEGCKLTFEWLRDMKKND